MDGVSTKKWSIQTLVPGAVVIRGLVCEYAGRLLHCIGDIAGHAPFRRVVTPGGKPMSVEMTNCGDRGWVSDHRGYRYEELDPISHRPWPVIPTEFQKVANQAAVLAGFGPFSPDVCLINRYAAGSSMGMHQDRDECNFKYPIVSVSLGLPIRFRIGGTKRGGPTTGTVLENGDVVVFGGPARLAFHGVGKLRAGHHQLTGAVRYNLTFRVSQ